MVRSASRVRVSSLVFITVLFFSVLSVRAEARGGGYSGGGEGWMFNPAFMYLYNQNSETGVTATTSNSRYLADVGLGYKFSGPFYLGATYSYDSTSTTTGAVSTSDSYNSYGPTVGLMSDNVYLLLSYFVVSTEANVNFNYSGGTGYEATVGYKFDLGSNWALAPALSYRGVSYTSKTPAGGGTSVTTDKKFATLVPYVSIWFSF